jgi:hypothetical protein
MGVAEFANFAASIGGKAADSPSEATSGACKTSVILLFGEVNQGVQNWRRRA